MTGVWQAAFDDARGAVASVAGAPAPGLRRAPRPAEKPQCRPPTDFHGPSGPLAAHPSDGPTGLIAVRPPTMTAQSPPSIDLPALLSRWDGDVRLVLDLAAKLERRMREDLRALRRQLAAADMAAGTTAMARFVKASPARRFLLWSPRGAPAVLLRKREDSTMAASTNDRKVSASRTSRSEISG